MPYAILSGALPAARMGVYMGIFNFFIVIPEIIASFVFGRVIRTIFGETIRRADVRGDGRRSLLVLAASVVSAGQDVADKTCPRQRCLKPTNMNC